MCYTDKLKQNAQSVTTLMAWTGIPNELYRFYHFDGHFGFSFI